MKVIVAALACLICGGDLRAQALLHATPVTSASAEITTATALVATPTAPAVAPTVGGGAASVFRSAVDLVSLNVIVTDAKDKFVTGLQQKDFAVYEDGVQQDVSFFAAANVPLDLAILLDTSSSMTGKMPTVKKAAIGFASHLRQGDRITVVGIKESARTLHPLDEDMSGAREAINQATASGGTALYNALYTTIKQMQKVHAADGDIRRQAIAVLTDGDDTASLVTYDDLMAVAKDAGVAIYTITLRSSFITLALTTKSFSESEFAMKAIAQETGARSFFPTDIAQLDGVYGVITDELANQYALGYTSNNQRRDGAFRRIVVRLTEPNVRTRTRSGYQTTTTQPPQVSLNR